MAMCMVVPRRVWLMCVACMRDTTGVAIDEQLAYCRAEFRERVYDIALREHHDGYGRTWQSWRARRLATIAMFFAYMAREAIYTGYDESHQGERVWMIRGIPKGALQVATRIYTLVHGVALKVDPSLNTIYTDICELVESGLLLKPEQYAWNKVPRWACGKQKADGTQWAFMYYFLTVQPFEGAAPTKVFKTPAAAPLRAAKPQAPVSPPAVVEAPAADELDRLDEELRRGATPAPVDELTDAGDAGDVAEAMRDALSVVRGLPPPSLH